VKSLNTSEWMDYPLIHRWMRSAYRRGHSWVNNQICVGTGNGAKVSRVSRNVVAVEFCGDAMKAKRYKKIRLLFKVGRVTPKGNLRIIFRPDTGAVELHYPKLVKRVEQKGIGAIGLDKGFTEAFTDSNGTVYGDGIGKVMNRATDKRHQRGKARNRLWLLAQKKPHIHRCNLGKKRLREFESRKKRQLTVMVRAGVNQIFNQYNTAIVEDLSAQIKGKKQAKSRNRKLSEWCKGTLQTALDEISHRCQSSVMVVNAAYTSQMDSRNGTLLGFRSWDSFFTFDGVVLQADCNAARNIEARYDDPEITRYMKHSDVRRVLMSRTASFLAVMGLTLQDAVNRNWLDPKHLQEKKARNGTGKSRSQGA
jgi:transposase